MNKIWIFLGIALLIASARAQELASSTTSANETIVAPTTTQIVPVIVMNNLSTDDTRKLRHLTNETIGNLTVTTIEEPTTIPTTTTTLTEPTTTIEITTITIPAPVCGNLYQEIGEECDTTASACGEGHWRCENCKCINITVTPTSMTLPNGEVINQNTQTTINSQTTPNGGISTFDIIGIGIIVIILAVALIYKLGGNGKE
jgi:hypothetical protein